MRVKTVACMIRLLVFLSFAPCVFSGFPRQASAQDGGERKYGVIHNIAEDRKVERIGGIYEPEGLDKYMKRHFDAILSELRAVQSRLTAVEAALSEMSKSLKPASKDETLVS